MMLSTHALGGMAIALVTLYAAPEFAGVALLAGLLGGIFPDLDLYVGHRKTLHYPVYFSVLALPALALAALSPSSLTVFAAFFLTGAAAHSASDILGGGLELRPWEATSERAVYDHWRGRWIAPRRWIQYDGSPGNLLLSRVLVVPLAVALDGLLYWIVIGALAVATSYAAVRRYLPTLAAVLVDVLAPRLPDPSSLASLRGTSTLAEGPAAPRSSLFATRSPVRGKSVASESTQGPLGH